MSEVHPEYKRPQSEESILREKQAEEERQKQMMIEIKKQERVKQGRDPDDETLCSFFKQLEEEKEEVKEEFMFEGVLEGIQEGMVEVG